MSFSGRYLCVCCTYYNSNVHLASVLCIYLCEMLCAMLRNSHAKQRAFISCLMVRHVYHPGPIPLLPSRIPSCEVQASPLPGKGDEDTA